MKRNCLRLLVLLGFAVVFGLPDAARAETFVLFAFDDETGALEHQMFFDAPAARTGVFRAHGLVIVVTGTPDGTPIVMGTPDTDPIVMGTPDTTPIVMGTPDADPIATGSPDGDPIVMGTPDADPIVLGTPDTDPILMGSSPTRRVAGQLRFQR